MLVFTPIFGTFLTFYLSQRFGYFRQFGFKYLTEGDSRIYQVIHIGFTYSYFHRHQTSQGCNNLTDQFPILLVLSRNTFLKLFSFSCQLQRSKSRKLMKRFKTVNKLPNGGQPKVSVFLKHWYAILILQLRWSVGPLSLLNLLSPYHVLKLATLETQFRVNLAMPIATIRYQ